MAAAMRFSKCPSKGLGLCPDECGAGMQTLGASTPFDLLPNSV